MISFKVVMIIIWLKLKCNLLKSLMTHFIRKCCNKGAQKFSVGTVICCEDCDTEFTLCIDCVKKHNDKNHNLKIYGIGGTFTIDCECCKKGAAPGS